MKKKCVPVTTCVLLGPEPVFSDHAGDLLPPFPCLGLELATLTHLGEAVSLLRAESESHRINSGGAGGAKRHRQGCRQQACSSRDPSSASGNHQSTQGQCLTGRQHGCEWVHTGECGSAAKCFYREVFKHPRILWPGKGKEKKPHGECQQGLCRPTSFMSPLLVSKSFGCQVKTSQLSLLADTDINANFLQSTSRITTF